MRMKRDADEMEEGSGEEADDDDVDDDDCDDDDEIKGGKLEHWLQDPFFANIIHKKCSFNIIYVRWTWLAERKKRDADEDAVEEGSGESGNDEVVVADDDGDIQEGAHMSKPVWHLVLKNDYLQTLDIIRSLACTL